MREIIIPHVESLVDVSGVRSTLLLSSLILLRERGHFERYVSFLDPQWSNTILETLAPTWIPIEAALAHYAACDALVLDSNELEVIGHAVGDRIHGTFMQTLIAAARTAGLTPWVLLKRFDRLWGRLMQGGSVEVVKLGPKDLTVEILGCPLVRYTYFRVAFTGVVRAGFKVVGIRTAYVSGGPWRDMPARYVMKAAWV